MSFFAAASHLPDSPIFRITGMISGLRLIVFRIGCLNRDLDSCKLHPREASGDEDFQGATRRGEKAAAPPLTPEEHHLLEWLIENGSVRAQSFRPQLEGIRALRSCMCGSPSISLITLPGSPNGISDGGRVVCDLSGRTSKGELVGVLLFQKEGRLCELEAYSVDGEIKSVTQEFSFPLIDSLEEIEYQKPQP
jgi:hypothetical protein